MVIVLRIAAAPLGSAERLAFPKARKKILGLRLAPQA
jgi:hypothetical protein